MARKTKAEQQAEREAERQAQMAVAKATYTERMMSVLARAVKENFEMTVAGNEFMLSNRDARYSNEFFVHPLWDEAADMALYELERAVEIKEEERAESERLSQVRRQAFLKLTQEEQDALGLNDRNNW